MSIRATTVRSKVDAATSWAHGLFGYWSEQTVSATLSGTEVLALARAYDASLGRESHCDDDVIALLRAGGAQCRAQVVGQAEGDAKQAHDDAGIPLSRLLITRPDVARSADPPSPSRTAGGGAQQSKLLRAALEKMKRTRADDDGEKLPAPARDHDGTDASPLRLRSRLWQRRKTFVKTLVALAFAFVFMWVPLQRLLSTTSAQAVINARIVTIRAPIDGFVSSALTGLELGQQVAAGRVLLAITNPRADRAPLDRLERQREALLTAITVERVRKAAITGQIAAMKAQTDRFRNGRLGKLLKQVRALEADLRAARGSRHMAKRALVRARRLIASGVISQTRFDTAVEAELRARQRVAQLVERRAELKVEIGYLQRGTYVGDSYNDMPASERRRLDGIVQLKEAAARLDRLGAELKSHEIRIKYEKERFAITTRSTVRARTPGRIWELLVTPGEQVARGQDLVRLADCSSAFVTAAVSETVYQRLFIGQQARFRPRGGGADIHGWVIGLNGLASVRSSAAIDQKALDREPYKATIKFPGLSAGGQCHIGRSGIVIFDTAATTQPSASHSGADD